MDTALSVFGSTLVWFRINYSSFIFYTERDIVWTVQTKIIKQIRENNLPFQVFNDYPMLSSRHRGLSTDIAILDKERHTVELAIEFKYEPAHLRVDIPKNKFPVVDWFAVEKDIARIDEFVQAGKAKIGISILVDEGGFFHVRTPLHSHTWENWGGNTWVLFARTDCP